MFLIDKSKGSSIIDSLTLIDKLFSIMVLSLSFEQDTKVIKKIKLAMKKL